MHIKVIINNVIHNPEFRYAWGLSMFIDGLKEGILFDTGPDGDILLKNLELAGVTPTFIKHIFISHIHLDHVGGLTQLLDAVDHQPSVYIPKSISLEFEERIKRHGGNVVRIEKLAKLFDEVYSTGQLGFVIAEQSMVIKTQHGLTVITGCSHPKISKIVAHVKESFPDEHIYLVMGGFHLMDKNREYILDTMRYLKELGVEKISPSHCSGDLAREIAKEVFGEDNYIDSGAGAVINIP